MLIATLVSDEREEQRRNTSLPFPPGAYFFKTT